jgi:hypothetical protein
MRIDQLRAIVLPYLRIEILERPKIVKKSGYLMSNGSEWINLLFLIPFNKIAWATIIEPSHGGSSWFYCDWLRQLMLACKCCVTIFMCSLTEEVISTEVLLPNEVYILPFVISPDMDSTVQALESGSIDTIWGRWALCGCCVHMRDSSLTEHLI